MGVCAYGVHVPAWRLERSEVGQCLELDVRAGTRAVAGYDEDTTSMAVEAARAALAAADRPGRGQDVRGLLFATAHPAYADKSNAAVVHAALDLEPDVSAYDAGGGLGAAMGTLALAADSAAAGRPTLAALSDVRVGPAGSDEELMGGDGAAAFLFGPSDDVVAELIGRGSAVSEFLDRWRRPQQASGFAWEERFALDRYVEAAHEALDRAVSEAGLALTDVDRVAIAGMHRRAVTTVGRAMSRTTAVVDDLVDVIGTAGTAQPGIVLAHALDTAASGEVIALVHLADGANAMLFRATPALGESRRHRPRPDVAELVRRGMTVRYPRYLAWRGLLDRTAPRRPDPDRPAAPPAARAASWKFGLVGSRCSDCETLHLPPSRVCRKCHSTDRMRPERVAEEAGTVVAFQRDFLAHTPDPPMIVGVVNLGRGGRLTCEVTDVGAEGLEVGAEVEMTFRRLYSTSDGVHNYFWKARPRARLDAPKEESAW